MRVEHVRLEAKFYFHHWASTVDWIGRVLEAIPTDIRPRYFSKSERLRRRPEFEVANSTALASYLLCGPWHWFHGDGYQLSTDIGPDGLHVAWLFASKGDVGCRLALQWMSALPSLIYYAYAAVPDEIEYRNGYDMIIAGLERLGHGWVGQDIRRYVPGLYWLNFLSNGFAARHGVAADDIAGRTNARLTRYDDGFQLQSYDTPELWRDAAERIYSRLHSTPGVFSRERAGVDRVIETTDEMELISRLGREWP